MMEKRNKLLKQDFLEMIENPLTKHTVTNAGFILEKDSVQQTFSKIDADIIALTETHFKIRLNV